MTAHPTLSLTFDAVAEDRPGPKWQARWQRSWPAYRAWYLARGGESGPSRQACREALDLHMPELRPVWDRLSTLAGDDDLAARFLSTWCPPRYLSGCSVLARPGREARLLRNYDLSPDLNEGLLLRTEWTGTPVMGMSEFLWGVSDGINAHGLSVALAYGGSPEVAEGFGITTILRYILETCRNVQQALGVLSRIPSHMAYNLVLTDASGAATGVEVAAGGGWRKTPAPFVTNHQTDAPFRERMRFTRTHERHAALAKLAGDSRDVVGAFLTAPLYQDRHAEGFGTLFTAEYAPAQAALTLHWPGESWAQSLDSFTEGRRTIRYGARAAAEGADAPDWTDARGFDWRRLVRDYTRGRGKPIEAYMGRAAGFARS